MEPLHAKSMTHAEVMEKHPPVALLIEAIQGAIQTVHASLRKMDKPGVNTQDLISALVNVTARQAIGSIAMTHVLDPDSTPYNREIMDQMAATISAATTEILEGAISHELKSRDALAFFSHQHQGGNA